MFDYAPDYDDPPLHIAFAISTLQAGGAQRVAMLLAKQWTEAGHKVDVISFEHPRVKPHFALPAGVRLYALDLMGSSRGVVSLAGRSLWRARRVSATLRQLAPDIVVSFMTETNGVAIPAARMAGLPIVISERIHPAHHRIGRVRDVLRRLVYPFSDALVVQTEEIADYCLAAFRTPTVVLPNPVELGGPQGRCAEPAPGRRQIMAVGRLESQKGYDTLISAFARIAAEHPGWDLTIFGEGSERANLEARIAAHGLGHRVFLPGVVENAAQRLAGCDLFVHPARFEGAPNVVMEALAAGCCVVAADSPGGTRELLQDGRYGVLVGIDDCAGLAREMSALMRDDASREALRRQAPEAMAPYDARWISGRWIELFRRVLAARRAAFEQICVADQPIVLPKGGRATLAVDRCASFRSAQPLEGQCAYWRLRGAGLLACVPFGGGIIRRLSDRCLKVRMARDRPKMIIDATADGLSAAILAAATAIGAAVIRHDHGPQATGGP